MPLVVKQYLELAKSCRNLAALAVDDEARKAMLSMADDYERKAEIRENSIRAARDRAASPLVPPEAVFRP